VREFLSRAIYPIDPKALSSEVSHPDAETFDPTTHFFVTIGMTAKRRNQHCRIFGTDFVAHVVFVKHRIEICDRITFLGEFQFT
jgi:hypothetical protein